MIITAGSTSQRIVFTAVDEDGLPLTGKTHSDFALSYLRDGSSSATSISLSSGTLGTYSSGGLSEIGEGEYELSIPNAAIAAGVSRVRLFGSVDGGVVIPTTIYLNVASAAAVEAVHTDTQRVDGMIEAHDDGDRWSAQAQSAVETGSGGGIVTGVAATVQSGEVRSPRLLAYLSSPQVWQFTFTDQAGTAIDVDGAELRLVVKSGDGAQLINVTATGSENTGEFEVPADAHAVQGHHLYSVRNDSDGERVLAKGDYFIQLAVIKEDP